MLGVEDRSQWIQEQEEIQERRSERETLGQKMHLLQEAQHSDRVARKMTDDENVRRFLGNKIHQRKIQLRAWEREIIKI